MAQHQKKPTPKQKKAAARRRAVLAQGCMALVILALLFGNCYAVARMFAGQPVLSIAWPQDGESASAPASESAGSAAAAPESAPKADEAWDTMEALPATVNAGQSPAAISSLLAVPENGKVSLEYFRDALFIGDSVTEGLAIYPPVNTVATVFGIRSASPQTFLNNGSVYDHGRKVEVPAVWDAIAATSPGKIYIMLGTNSIVGNPEDDSFLHYYDELLTKISQTFPGVPVYVQSVSPVTKACAEYNTNYSLSRLHTLNNKVAQLALAHGYYFVDMHEALAGDDGYLPDSLAASLTNPASGMHMNPDGYAQWIDYLQRHTVYSPLNLPYVETLPYV